MTGSKETIELKAQIRETTSQADKLRKQGLIPAVLYGHNIKNLLLTLNLGEFEKTYKKAGESTIVNLEATDGKKHSVLIQDVQFHHLTSKPTHVDFYEVSMTEKLKAKVALEFIGEAKAVKQLGGVLVKTLNEIEVQCLPADLPHNIEVDISKLETFQDSIHVKDLSVSSKVEILTKPEEMIAKIQPPRDVEAELKTEIKEDVEAVIAASTEKPTEEESAEETKKE